jgi:hypothetical protein
MPATSKARRRARPKPQQAPLPRQHEQKLVPHPTLMARKRIVDHLNDTIGACEDLFHEHGESCSCETCCVTSNLVGAVRVFHMLLQIS